jgi:hypothetical protein
MQSPSEIYSEIERKMDSRMNEMIKGDMKENNDLLCWCLTKSNLSREQILDVLLDMLFGAFDTTSIALSRHLLSWSLPQSISRIKGNKDIYFPHLVNYLYYLCFILFLPSNHYSDQLLFFFFWNTEQSLISPFSGKLKL